MKLKAALLFLNVILFLPQLMQAETWTQKADFGGAARYDCLAFSIGVKGYIGLGNNNTLTEYNDFWEWNQLTETWTQKANFPGKAREGASGFSIDIRGFVCCGYSAAFGGTTEFWEWNQSTNTWIQRSNLSGGGRTNTVVFSIGMKGYICAGAYQKDLWEWDGDTVSATYNTWTRKADFGGLGKAFAAGFSIGKKGYIGTGTNGNNFENTFWEWDGDTASPSYNTWTQKASLIGGARVEAVGFSIGNKGYIGTGIDSTGQFNLKDFWEWDQASNIWTRKLDFGGLERQLASGFSIGSRGYIGTGWYTDSLSHSAKDFWEYCDTCTVGIDELNNKNIISLYPNPSNGIFFLQSKIEKATVSIYSLKGEKVYSTEINSQKAELDISKQPEGIYILNITSEEGNTTHKIIVQH